MRYKSLFRVLVKVIGVYLIAAASVSFLSEVMRAVLILVFAMPSQLFSSWLQDYGFLGWAFYSLVPNLIQALVGLLLFFRVDWIANHAIPSNRPYCVECGYDLTGHTTEKCPECGTAKPNGDMI